MKLTHLIVLLVVGYFAWKWWQGQQQHGAGKRSARTGMVG